MGEFDNLHQILLSLYDEMMPLCADMTGVAKGLAGLGAQDASLRYKSHLRVLLTLRTAPQRRCG